MRIKRHVTFVDNTTQELYFVSDYVLLRWSSNPALSFLWQTCFLTWFIINAAYNYRNFQTKNGSFHWKSLTFLTRWAELLNIIYSVYSFLVVGTTIITFSGDLFEQHSTIFHHFLGLFFQVQAASSFSITFFFYSVIYTRRHDLEHFTYQSINLHMLQSLQIL